jgi:hypothetical protein
MALVETVPALAAVRCYDIDAVATGAFIAEMGARLPALRFDTCAGAADVVVTAVPIVTDPAPDLDAGVLGEAALRRRAAARRWNAPAALKTPYFRPPQPSAHGRAGGLPRPGYTAIEPA